MKVNKTDYDIIVREIYEKLTDEDYQVIEVPLDDYDVIVRVDTYIEGHNEIGAQYMGSYEIVSVEDSITHNVISVEIWNKDGDKQFDSESLLKKLQNDII